MRKVREYHRPASVDEALALLRRPGVRSAPLAGGTALVGDGGSDVEAVVDLQDLGLSYVRAGADGLHLGATTHLQDLVDSPLVNTLAGGLVARAAHATTTSVLRHQATLAGTLIADVNADLVPALLVLDAELVIRAPDERHLSLAAFYSDPSAGLGGGLLLEARVPTLAPAAGTAFARVARTPGDRSIVGVAVLLAVRDGRCKQARLAACGAGPVPLRLRPAEAVLEGHEIDMAAVAAAAEAARATVAPISDYLGSAEYRRAMVAVLAARAMREAWENIG